MRLLAISDVTCDYMGSIDFMRHFTTIEKPFFVYRPESDEIVHDIDNTSQGILYNSIENMPSEFPYDASEHFGSRLFPFIEGIMNSDATKPLKEQGLPPQIERAVIADKGQLTNLFTYITKLREQKRKLSQKAPADAAPFARKNSIFRSNRTKTRMFKLRGHLFDRKTINKLLDYVVGGGFFRANCRRPENGNQLSELGSGLRHREPHRGSVRDLLRKRVAGHEPGQHGNFLHLQER